MIAPGFVGEQSPVLKALRLNVTLSPMDQYHLIPQVKLEGVALNTVGTPHEEPTVCVPRKDVLNQLSAATYTFRGCCGHIMIKVSSTVILRLHPETVPGPSHIHLAEGTAERFDMYV